MDLIKRRMDKYILSLIEKEELTPEEYAILAIEYERRKEEKENTCYTLFKVSQVHI